jgi:hypothetical protein
MKARPDKIRQQDREEAFHNKLETAEIKLQTYPDESVAQLSIHFSPIKPIFT